VQAAARAGSGEGAAKKKEEKVPAQPQGHMCKKFQNDEKKQSPWDT
jgi:hypothetical protein